MYTQQKPKPAPTEIDISAFNTKITNLVKQAEIKPALDEVIRVAQIFWVNKQYDHRRNAEDVFTQSVRDLLCESKEFSPVAKEAIKRMAAIFVAEGDSWKNISGYNRTDKQDLINHALDFGGGSDYKVEDAKVIVNNILELLKDPSLTDTEVSNIKNLGELAGKSFDFGGSDILSDTKKIWKTIKAFTRSQEEKKTERPASPIGAAFRLLKPAEKSADPSIPSAAPKPAAPGGFCG